MGMGDYGSDGLESPPELEPDGVAALLDLECGRAIDS